MIQLWSPKPLHGFAKYESRSGEEAGHAQTVLKFWVYQVPNELIEKARAAGAQGMGSFPPLISPPVRFSAMTALHRVRLLGSLEDMLFSVVHNDDGSFAREFNAAARTFSATVHAERKRMIDADPHVQAAVKRQELAE